MQRNHPLIAYAYHFLSEAIIIFMLFIPVLYHRYFFVPYWSYLAVIGLACVVFTLIKKLNVNLFVYLLVAPLLFGIFYFLDYPILMVILFSGLLVWRYMAIQNQELIRRETLYILFTVVATVFVSIFVHDSEFMMYPFLQFILLFFGYISSHLVHVAGEDRKQIDRKIPGYFVGLLLAGAGVFFVAYPLLRSITVTLWDGLILLVSSTILGVSNFLSFWKVEKRGWPEQEPEEAKHGDGYWDELQEYNIMEEMSGLIIFAIVIVLLFVLVLLAISFAKRQVKKRFIKVETKEAVSNTNILIHRDNIVDRKKVTLFNRKVKAPDNLIRKMVFQFERKADKYKKGRKAHETIEDWFRRIGIEADINVYQGVRYGNHHVSDTEKESLQKQLKLMEAKLEAK